MSLNLVKVGGLVRVEQTGKSNLTITTRDLSKIIEHDESGDVNLGKISFYFGDGTYVLLSGYAQLQVSGVAATSMADMYTKLATVFPNATSGSGGSGLSELTPTAVKTADYTAAAGDFVPTDNTAGSLTVTLPTTPADKTLIAVKMVVLVGSNIITIAAGGSDVFNKAGGSTTLTLSLLNQALLLQYKSSTGIWYVISTDAPIGNFAQINGVTGGQIFIGGKGTTDTLIFRTTSGVGTTGADMIFQVGNNGGTEAMRIYNNGQVSIGGNSFLTNGNTLLSNLSVSSITSPSNGTANLNIVAGHLGIGVVTPVAALHLKANSASAGGAAMMFAGGGTRLSSPVAGALEYETGKFIIQSDGLELSSYIVAAKMYNGVIGSQCVIKGNSNGVLAIYNTAESDFGRLQFGGSTSSFPALKRNGVQLQVRLADDSGDADVSASALTIASISQTGSFTSNTGPAVFNATFNSNGTSQAVSSLKITPTYNQPSATSVANTDLLINRTETSLGTTPGNQKLIDLQVSGTSKFTVFNTGLILAAATTTAAASLRLPAGTAPTSPVDGDIWREDNTNTGLKVRINGVTKTITVS